MNTLPLWRRCRALANGRRMEMLLLLSTGEAHCVKEIADKLGIAEDIACKHLQLLASAGWVSKAPAGRYLYYTLYYDNVLLNEVLTYTRKKGIDRLIFMVTGLTHERRIWIIKALEPGSMTFDELYRTTRIPSMALNRHLDKLQRRGFVTYDKKMWMLVISDVALGQRLIESAVNDITPAQV